MPRRAPAPGGATVPVGPSRSAKRRLVTPRSPGPRPGPGYSVNLCRLPRPGSNRGYGFSQKKCQLEARARKGSGLLVRR